ncbi:general transcription factor IIIA, b [Denticeps clupeoides]|uniref:general transcription factor IIIA, b n=1 Tax=Denticeps clupeoides TaxID=299321 RepID=UPI0010A48FE5|nr:transcription factor IIIA-like [Denticeps clupeoides]
MGEKLHDPRKNFVCSFLNCKASYTKAWKLDAHLCKHTGLRPFACEDCDRSFCARRQLARHRLTHGGERPCVCSAAAGMKSHVAQAHQRSKRYKCDHEGCTKDFHKRGQLKGHKIVHVQLFDVQCSFEGCGRSFTTSKLMTHHLKVHKGYPCGEEDCSFQGKTWTEYQSHKKLEHRLNLQCDQCKRVFHKACFLHAHQKRVHSGERCVFRCTTEGCQQSYTTRFNLQNHVRSFHEGTRPFSCPHAGCGKAFAMEESLKRHSVVHDPERKKIEKKTKPKQEPSGRAKVSDAAKLAVRLQNFKLNPEAQNEV